MQRRAFRICASASCGQTAACRRGGARWLLGRSGTGPRLAAVGAPTRPPCNNPTRSVSGRHPVEIDTTGGPGFGFEHFKELDFLRDKEVVLTFDDDPWPVNTPAVLKTLAEECTTGIFFPIGKHATYYPEILRQVMAAGHSIGSHTWSHAALVNKKLNEQQRKDEIEKGFSAVKWALGGKAPAPFFRFPRCSTRRRW